MLVEIRELQQLEFADHQNIRRARHIRLIAISGVFPVRLHQGLKQARHRSILIAITLTDHGRRTIRIGRSRGHIGVRHGKSARTGAQAPPMDLRSDLR